MNDLSSLPPLALATHRPVRSLAVLGALGAAALALLGWWGNHRLELAEHRHVLDALVDAGRGELAAARPARAALYLNEARHLGADNPAVAMMLGQAMQAVDARQWWKKTEGSAVPSLGFSADGRYLVATSFKDTEFKTWVVVWSLPEGRQLASFMMADKPDIMVSAPVISADGSKLMLLTQAYEEPQPVTLRVWSLPDGRPLAAFEAHKSQEDDKQPYGVFDPSARRLCYTGVDGVAHVVDLESGRSLLDLALPGRVALAAFSPDGRQILGGGDDGSAVIWDAASGERRLRLPGLPTAITTAAFSPDGRRVVAGSRDGSLAVWDAASGALQIAGGHRVLVELARFSDDGRRLFSIGRDGIRVSDARNGAPLLSLGDALDINSWAALSPDGRWLASSAGNEAQVWDVDANARLYGLDGHTGGTVGLAFSPDGTQLATGGADGGVALWKLQFMPMALIDHNPSLDPAQRLSDTDADFDDSGQRFATAGADGVVQIFDRASRALLKRWPAFDHPVTLLRWLPDGHRLSVLLGDGHIELLDPEDRQPGEHWDSGITSWGRFQYSHDSRYLLTTDITMDTVAKLRDLQLQRSLPPLPIDFGLAVNLHPIEPLIAWAHAGTIAVQPIDGGAERWHAKLADAAEGEIAINLSYQRDGRRLALITSEKRVLLLDAANGQVLKERRFPDSGPPLYITFAPDGSRLALVDVYSQTAIWDLQADHVQALSAAHGARINAVHFTRDGRFLITASQDRSVRIWDGVSGAAVMTLGYHGDAATAAELSPDGTLLLSGGRDGTVRLWNTAGETRSVEEVARRLDCRTPWRLEGEALVPQRVQDCDEASAASTVKADGK